MHTYGTSRDSRVLDGLERWRYATSAQIAEMYFKTVKNPQFRQQKANERLKKLYDRGFCHRMRVPGENYIYSLKSGTYHHKIPHYLSLVDVWVTLNKLRPSGANLSSQIEVKFEGLVCDLWIEHTNSFKGEKKEYFIEVELNSSGDIVQKIKKYEALFWARNMENKPNSVLVLLYKNKRTVSQLEGHTFDLPLKVIALERLESEWTW